MIAASSSQLKEKLEVHVLPEVLAGLANGGTATSTPVASTTTDPSTNNNVPDVSNLLSAYGYSTGPVTSPVAGDASGAAASAISA